MRKLVSHVPLRWGGLLAVAATLAACGGGGGGSSPGIGGAPSIVPTVSGTATQVAPSPSAAPAAGTAPATFTVVVPPVSTSSASRSPRYIAANTKAVSFTLLKTDAAAGGSGSAQTFPLGATQPYCSTQSAGLTCNLNVNAPVGNDVFVAATFSDTAGTQKIGSGAVQIAVQANARNTASISLGGPIANVATVAFPAAGDYYTRLLAGAPTPAPQTSGTPAPYATAGYTFYPSARLYVVGLDVNNNAIVAPDNYSTPVTLTVQNGYPGYGYAYSGARQPRALAPTPPATPGPTAAPTATPTPLPTATPTATPVPTATPIAAIITVTHRDGTSASTSMTNFSVNVTAPDDIVTVTPTTTTQTASYAYNPYYYNITPIGFMITATVGSASASRTFNVQPANCPTGFTGSPPGCVAPSPPPASPTPVPTACPTGYSGAPPYCNVPALSFSASAPRFSTTYQYDSQGYYVAPTVQFLSAADAPITISVTDQSTVASAPQVWVTNTSSSCSALLSGASLPQSVTLTGVAGNWIGSFALAPAAYGTCQLSVWAYPADGTRVIPFNISINGVTGTIK